jgi:hypothetical protein
MRGRRSVRVLLGALVCSALVVAAATPASATGTTPHAAGVTGTTEHLDPDGSCPPNADFPTDPGYRAHIAGKTWTRFGPAKINVDLCFVFVGAIGGEELVGSFSVSTLAGTLRGTAAGAVGFGATDHYSLTLTVNRATWFLANVRGTLKLDGDEGRDGPGFVGTLTSDLHRSWGHWHGPTPFPFT